MGGKIDCYLDVASFFSYVAFANLRENLDLLKQHGVVVEFHPVLIAGINNLSGNKPPWMLPAKGKYLQRDTKRASERVNRPGLSTPKDFMSMSLTTSPLRALHYIKAKHPVSVFLDTFEHLFGSLWTAPHVNLTKDDELAGALSKAKDRSGKLLFGEQEVSAIMAGRAEMKDVLKAKTEEAVKLGAFGAPWFWVVNGEGTGDAFFGSDRFNHMYRHLGIPFQDVTILPPSKL